MTIKSVVVIDGEKIEIKDLEDKDEFADRINRQALLLKNYEEETAEVLELCGKWQKAAFHTS